MKLHNIQLFTSLLLIIALCSGFLQITVRATYAVDYYISSNGSDDNPGTITQPWKTLEHAFAQLSPGDNLYLRGGTYYPQASKDGIEISLRGTESAPITIASYPGERAWINGGVPDFESAPNTEWELVDASINLYRSRQPVAFTTRGLGAWLLDQEMLLITYDDFAVLTSTNYDAGDYSSIFYAGPGVHGGADGHVYIRLETNPNDLFNFFGNPIPPIFSDLNPNHHRISIFSGDPLITLNNSSYVVLRDLDLGPRGIVVNIDASSHHIEIAGNYTMSAGLALTVAGSHHDIHHNDMASGVKAWVWWGDAKEGVAPASSMADINLIEGAIKESNIHDNVFREGFDGATLREGSANSRVTNNVFLRVRDDAIAMGATVSNLEIASNIIRHSFEGISISGNYEDSTSLGDVYIHHNVIDLTWLHQMHRAGSTADVFAFDYAGRAWKTAVIWGGHGVDGTKASLAKWKMYNNTLIGKYQGSINGEGDSTPNMMPRSINNAYAYYYNNLVYTIGHGPVMYTASDEHNPRASDMHFDGNIYWKTGDRELFVGYGGDIYQTLKDFLNDSRTAPWDRTNALEIDPGFNDQAILAENYDLATLWELYRPKNPQIFTPGVSYNGLDWPGTQGVTYRGAVKPDPQVSIKVPSGVPDEFYLYQNYPNPFNSSTAISYRLSQSSHVILTLYNTNGQEVYKLVDEFQAAGTYTVKWNGMNNARVKVSSGIYFYRIEALNYSIIKKMLLLQ